MLTIACIEEPPFDWTNTNQSATGADIELAETILRAIGVTQINYFPTTFAELLPGVETGRWDMNVPLLTIESCFSIRRQMQSTRSAAAGWMHTRAPRPETAFWLIALRRARHRCPRRFGEPARPFTSKGRVLLQERSPRIA